jgi:hypothetical protein
MKRLIILIGLFISVTGFSQIIEIDENNGGGIIFDIGNNITNCKKSTIPLRASISGQDSLMWFGGTGTFSNVKTVSTIYTPSIADTTSGHVTIKLAGYYAFPSQDTIWDSKLITFIDCIENSVFPYTLPFNLE